MIRSWQRHPVTGDEMIIGGDGLAVEKSSVYTF